MRIPFMDLRALWSQPRSSSPPVTASMTTEEQRAEALLLRHLTTTQQKTYLRDGYFEVIGKDGSLWTISRGGGTQNVQCINGKGSRTFCSYVENVPRADTLLVQKLSIEATGGRGLPRLEGDLLTDGHLFYATPEEHRERVHPNVPDPVALSQAALAHRKQNRMRYAERLLRQSIELEDQRVAADSHRRPHRRNNLALVLVRAGKFAAAWRSTHEAWRLNAGERDVTAARILVVRIATRLLCGSRDVGFYLGQLKTLLAGGPLVCPGNLTPTWDVPDLTDMLRRRLRCEDAELLVWIVKVIDGAAPLDVLDIFPAWGAAPPVSLEMPWPTRFIRPVVNARA